MRRAFAVPRLAPLQVAEVFRPKGGVSFALVRFKEDADAAKCVAELKAVDGAAVRVRAAPKPKGERAAQCSQCA